MERNTRRAPLGLQRVRVLDCLGGNQRRSPGYFEPDPDADIHTAYRDHIHDLSRRWAHEPDPYTAAMLAAARVLTGDLAGADTVIDNLPDAPPERDHGHGYCRVAAVHALAAALPLPEELRDTTHWLSGSSYQAALRSWLAEHRARLRWVEADAAYVLI